MNEEWKTIYSKNGKLMYEGFTVNEMPFGLLPKKAKSQLLPLAPLQLQLKFLMKSKLNAS